MTTKTKCILLDDELPGLTYLKMLCEQVEGLEVVKAFANPLKFIEELPNLDFDFCILDIEMPGLNGLEVAQLLGKKPIIFTTAYKEYAAEAYDLEAIDYVRKPIQKERFEKAVSKAITLITERKVNRQYIQLNTDKGKTLLFFHQILFITSAEKDKRDKIARLEDGKTLTLKNISYHQLLALLPPDFCRINKKEIIALKTVRFFSHHEITTNIPDASGKDMTFILGDIYRSDFTKKLNQ